METKIILLLEDDLFTSRFVKHFFEERGYIVYQSFDIGSTFQHLSTREFDCIILDITLPSGTSLDKIQQFKKMIGNTPIIFYTSNKKNSVELKGLELGASDFILKERGVLILFERVTRIINNKVKIEENTLDKDKKIEGTDILISPSTNTIKNNNISIVLSRKECALLYLLATNYPNSVSKDLMAYTHNGNGFDNVSRSLDIALSRLRKKILILHKIEIKTIRSKGYILVVNKDSLI